MKMYTQTRNYYVSLIVAGLMLLSGCGGGGGSSAPPPLLEDGVFTVVSFHGEESGGPWDTTSSAFDCDLDGVDTVYIDSDRDGDFSDEVLTYEVLEDGTMTVDLDTVGAYSEDGSTIATTDATSADVADFSLGLREGSGLSVDTFNGPYLVTKFAANNSFDIAHTYTAMATETGYGLGAFAVVLSSDPGAVGTASPFHYTVEDNGNIFFTDSHEEGMIKSDGSFFIAADTDTANDIESIMVGIAMDEHGGTMTNADLEGEYIGNLIGRNLVTGEYWSARILATFDGLGLVRYEYLAHTSGAGGATGYLAYRVAHSGALLVGPPLEAGAVSQDGSIFCVVDTDTTDGQIYMMVGIKKQ